MFWFINFKIFLHFFAFFLVNIKLTSYIWAVKIMIVYFWCIFAPKVLQDNEKRNSFLFTILYFHYLYLGLPTGKQLFFISENAVPSMGMFRWHLSEAFPTLGSFVWHLGGVFQMLGKLRWALWTIFPTLGKCFWALGWSFPNLGLHFSAKRQSIVSSVF